jgi:rhodanese-related sulfurtransferase
LARLSVDDWLAEARLGLVRLAAPDAYSAMQAGATLVDTRLDDHRRRTGSIAGALEVSLNVLEWRLDPDSPYRHPRAPALDDLVVVLCEQGYSSSLAAARLQRLGFARATDVIGGFEAWATAGLPVVRWADGSRASSRRRPAQTTP